MDYESLVSYAVAPDVMGGVPRSPHWPAVRRRHLEDNPTCAACGGTESVQVHHVQPYHLQPALELDPGNLLTLCEAPHRLCHIRVGHVWNFQLVNTNSVEDAERELSRVMQTREGVL